MSRLKNDFDHAESGLFENNLGKNSHSAEKHFFLLISIFGNVTRSRCNKNDEQASVAQLVELLICNQWVGGSSPFAGSIRQISLNNK